MRPLKVTAFLCSPLAGDAPQLDALLEWSMSSRMRAVMESRNGGRHRTGFPKYRGEPVVPGAIPIPLVRERVCGFAHPVARCSAPVLPEPSAEWVEHYTRRFAAEEAHLLHPGERTVVSSTGGEFKSYRLPLRVRRVDRVVWFCLGRTGNPNRASPGKEIRRLLNRECRAIGKKTEYGYGRVARWLVEPMEEDRSWFAESEAGPVLMRTLPAGAVPAGVVGARRSFAACCAPYWSPDTLAECYEPC